MVKDRFPALHMHRLIFLSCFIFLHLPSFSVALIPRACARNISLTPAICCPVPKGFSNPCGFPHRGLCRVVQVYDPVKVPNFTWIYDNDVRQYWPKRVFQHTCQCSNNFAGPSCDDCAWGWSGSNCQHRVLFKRRNIKTYTPEMKRKFQQVLVESRKRVSEYVWPLNLGSKFPGYYQNMSYQEELVTIHWFAAYTLVTANQKTCKKFDKKINYNHNGPAFPFWHRYFLLLWEYRSREIATDLFGWTNFTFPYWDWTDAKKCEVCTDDLICSSSNKRSPGGGFLLSEKCPFSKWSVICSDVETRHCSPCYARNTGEKMNREFLTNHFPTSDEVRTSLSIPIFYNMDAPCTGYSEYFEGFVGNCECHMGIHNMVHMNINGPFNRSRTAANDLLFIFHHSQLDRLFQRWYSTVHPSQKQLPYFFVKPGHTRNENLIGFIPAVSTKSMMTDVRSLGFDYDNYDFGNVKGNERIKVLNDINEFKTCKKTPKT